MCLAPSMPKMPEMPSLPPPPPPPPAPPQAVQTEMATVKPQTKSPAEKRGTGAFRKPMQTIQGQTTGLNPLSSK